MPLDVEGAKAREARIAELRAKSDAMRKQWQVDRANSLREPLLALGRELVAALHAENVPPTEAGGWRLCAPSGFVDIYGYFGFGGEAGFEEWLQSISGNASEGLFMDEGRLVWRSSQVDVLSGAESWSQTNVDEELTNEVMRLAREAREHRS